MRQSAWERKASPASFPSAERARKKGKPGKGEAKGKGKNTVLGQFERVCGAGVEIGSVVELVSREPACLLGLLCSLVEQRASLSFGHVFGWSKWRQMASVQESVSAIQRKVQTPHAQAKAAAARDLARLLSSPVAASASAGVSNKDKQRLQALLPLAVAAAHCHAQGPCRAALPPRCLAAAARHKSQRAAAPRHALHRLSRSAAPKVHHLASGARPAVVPAPQAAVCAQALGGRPSPPPASSALRHPAIRQPVPLSLPLAALPVPRVCPRQSAVRSRPVPVNVAVPPALCK
ncbi:hypothetical protein HK096_000859 [Nowakowskiella sp. JEL0078]|nr:hypothetical protein HK096_000859 [Nowakowskiella sp. JEL0078]